MKITFSTTTERAKAIAWLCRSLHCDESELFNVLISDHFEELANNTRGSFAYFIDRDKIFQKREEAGDVVFFEPGDGRGFFDSTHYGELKVTITTPGEMVKKTGHYALQFIED